MKPLLYCAALLLPILGTGSCLKKIDILSEGREWGQHTKQHICSIQQLIKQEEWQKLGEAIQSALHKKIITANDLYILAQRHPSTPFAHACEGMNHLLALHDTGLTPEVAFPITLFIETSFIHERAERHFWPSSRFGRELQYDPEHDALFIHLGSDHVAPIGKGRQKLVTKTILYSKDMPVIMARGETFFDISQEMNAMRALINKPGVIQAQALFSHTDPQSLRTKMAVITRIYKPGSLHKVLLDKKTSFSLKEKIGIARDIMTGLTSIHQIGYVHRDLGARNYFIDISSKNRGHRSINCVIADMGRTRPIGSVTGLPAQGNSMYIAPEGLYYTTMIGDNYIATDLFASGCVLWTIYHGKFAPWMKKYVWMDPKTPIEQRHKKYTERIVSAQKEYIQRITQKQDQHIPLSIQERFLLVILTLTNPDPTRRGSAEQHQATLQALYEQL